LERLLKSLNDRKRKQRGGTKQRVVLMLLVMIESGSIIGRRGLVEIGPTIWPERA
jgi:hypothetical protein